MTLFSQYLLGDYTLNEQKLKGADVNNDGEIGLPDLAHLKQYIMKDSVTLGPK